MTCRVPLTATPDELIQRVLVKRANRSTEPMQNVESYTLKICGLAEYLLGEYPLSQFNVSVKDV